MTARRRALSPRARLAGLAMIAVLLPTGWWLLAHEDDGNHWVEVRRADLALTVEVTGTLKAVDSDLLGPPQVTDLWEFKISFLAPEGAHVKRGQPALGFDASALQRDLEEKVAERDTAAKEIEKKQGELALSEHDDALRVAEAEAWLRKAALKVARPEELVTSKELIKAELDLELAEREVAYLKQRAAMLRRATATEITALRRTHARAAARVAEIEDAIGRMSVTSMRDGTVIHTVDWRGDKRKVGDTVWRGDKVVEVPDLRVMIGKGEVDEADAGRIAIGQPILLRLDAHPDLEFRGHVGSIAGNVERTSRQNPLKVVRLDVVLERTDVERMRPGMRFRGAVETSRLRDVLVVPLDAVFPTPSGPVVYRRTLTGAAAITAQTGARSEGLVEIVAGISAGDEVSRRPPPRAKGQR